MRRGSAALIAMFVTVGLLLAAPLVPLSQPYRHSIAWQVPVEHGPIVEPEGQSLVANPLRDYFFRGSSA
jgi:hypothetical protein